MDHNRNDSRAYDGAAGRHGRGGEGSRRGDDLLDRMFAEAPDAQMLFVGSVNCLRHKPFLNIGKRMQEGKASILCPSMTDFATGRYLHQIVDAIVEISQERNSKHFVLTFGCQWVILSTDGEMLCEELKNEHGIEVTLYDDSHLEFGDHE